MITLIRIRQFITQVTADTAVQVRGEFEVTADVSICYTDFESSLSVWE